MLALKVLCLCHGTVRLGGFFIAKGERMYKCKYFKISELVAPALVKALPENTLWALFDERLLRMADAIREKYGPCTVNGGGLTDCGLRDPQSATGAKYSMHKIGRALDMHIRSIELRWSGNIELGHVCSRFQLPSHEGPISLPE